MTDEHERLADLLELVWRGTSKERKSRYRMTIWDEFENAVRASAYTNSLGKFTSVLCAKLDAQVGTNDDERARAGELLSSGQDRAWLKLAREETALVVLLVRLRNQDRREQWEAAHSGPEIDTTEAS